jgi:hypothetical protein
MTCQIVGCYRNGRTIPLQENLQKISNEIQDGLEVGFKPFISIAAKHAPCCDNPALAQLAAYALAVIGNNLPRSPPVAARSGPFSSAAVHAD